MYKKSTYLPPIPLSDNPLPSLKADYSLFFPISGKDRWLHGKAFASCFPVREENSGSLKDRPFHDISLFSDDLGILCNLAGSEPFRHHDKSKIGNQTHFKTLKIIFKHLKRKKR